MGKMSDSDREMLVFHAKKVMEICERTDCRHCIASTETQGVLFCELACRPVTWGPFIRKWSRKEADNDTRRSD